ncbi:MAG TPA: arylesterase [Lichenihabitans sp.]|jgi:acyl-CoA thioesterase-1|nr:arylesterase [Lichenihabitans sp.]
MAVQTASAKTFHVVAFGDSLSAGFELPQDAAFPAQLEKALKAEGIDATVTNAGVSGDTAEDGAARVDWSVPDGTDLVIVELGANDMLRGMDPAGTKTALDAILARLQARGIKVLLAGMLAAPNLGADYGGKFDAIYPALARDRKVPLYPFFLAGIVGKPELHVADGMHPNRQGVAVIVRNILPDVEAALRGN